MAFDRQPVGGSQNTVPPISRFFDFFSKENMQTAYDSAKTYLSGGDDLSNQNVFSAFNNALTGNRDYQRQQELLRSEQMFNAEEAAKQRAFSADEAAKQRAWSTEQAKNAYTYAIEDAKRNGLNPYVVLGGGGSKVASGATAQGSSASVGSHGLSANTSTGILQLLGQSISALSASNLADKKLVYDATKWKAESGIASAVSYLLRKGK